MGSLIFSCPTSWKIIEPGIETDLATLRKVQDHSLSIDCPHCQLRHELKIRDGHLFEMRPRRSEVHYSGFLCDEIAVGAFVERARMKATESGLQRKCGIS